MFDGSENFPIESRIRIDDWIKKVILVFIRKNLFPKSSGREVVKLEQSKLDMQYTQAGMQQKKTIPKHYDHMKAVKWVRLLQPMKIIVTTERGIVTIIAIISFLQYSSWF